MKKITPKISKNNSTYILNNIAKEKANERKLLFFNVILMLIVIISVSYITIFAVGKDNIFEKIYTKKYFSHEENINLIANEINLFKDSIVKDSLGIKTTPISFKIINKKKEIASYTITLQKDINMISTDNCKNIQIDEDTLKFSLDGKNIKTLKDNNYIIMTGTIPPLTEETYNLYIWASNNLLKDKNKTHFHGQLIIKEN